jgi:hypothetical protein
LQYNAWLAPPTMQPSAPHCGAEVFVAPEKLTTRQFPSLQNPMLFVPEIMKPEFVDNSAANRVSVVTMYWSAASPASFEASAALRLVIA